MEEHIDIQKLIDISKQAGEEIMKVYENEIDVEYKSDDSPLTKADQKSNEIIMEWLQQFFPDIPIISEENKEIPFEERKNWEYYWLVDPLDGTKEFINKNWEFTTNIALIHKDEPVLWVIYVPDEWITYYAKRNLGSFKIDTHWTHHKLEVSNPTQGTIRVIASRSHGNDEATENYIENLKSKYEDIQFTNAWSSVKFCLIAEWKADIYPRLKPTMEWDTWAGHIIAQESWATIENFGTWEKLKYNKEDMTNPSFIVYH